MKRAITCARRRVGGTWSVLLCGTLLAATTTTVSAVEPTGKLPDPLTVNAVLSTPIDQQYAVMGSRAEVDQSKANLGAVDSWYGPQVTVEGRLRYIEPNDIAQAAGDGHNDNAISVTARQNLYDFGRRSRMVDAAKQNLAGAELDLYGTEQRQRLAILQAFFNVLLADQRYTTLNERMAIYYVRYDKAKDRRELGLTSDYDLARFEREYQDVLLERAQADADRRMTRRRLAELLGRPDQLPTKLKAPKLAALFKRPTPELDVALNDVLNGDSMLQALQARYSASEDSLQAARRQTAPSIYAQLEGESAARELRSTDPFRAGLYISFPLYQGGLRNAAIGKAQAERMKLQSAIAQRSARLREQTTDLLEMIQVYRGAGRSRVKAMENYSDLNFTRKQTLYQMEKATDLGDAMVEESAAKLARMKNDFALAMNWARLLMLEGKPVTTLFATAGTAKQSKESSQ